MADAFRTQVLQNKDAATTPVVTLGSCSFLYTREARESEGNSRALLLTRRRLRLPRGFRTTSTCWFSRRATQTRLLRSASCSRRAAHARSPTQAVRQ